MGAVRMKLQTMEKTSQYYTCIPHDSSPSINALWNEKLFFFYQLFGISFWRHPFNAEDAFVNKWCNAKFLKKKLIYFVDGLTVKVS